jgi:hypothetical protein
MSKKLEGNFEVEINKATDEELDQIKNEIVKRLSKRATQGGGDLSSHCRVSTLHSKF